MKRIIYSMISLSMLTMIFTACEEDEFQSGLNISDVGQVFASNGDINRAAYKRANGDGSLTSILSTGERTAFLPYDQAYKNAGYINAESVNEGDAAVLKNIILYHVFDGARKANELSGNISSLLAGKSFSVNSGSPMMVAGLGNAEGAVIVATDAIASNGFIHTVDELLLPAPRTIGDIAIDNGYFDIFEAALLRADLMSLADGNGAFTVFVPGDAAFISYLEIPTKDANGNDRPYSAVQADAIAAINAKTPGDLADLIRYHIVDDKLMSDDFVVGALTTLSGEDITIALDDNGKLASVTGNASSPNLLQFDVSGSNGVIHIIDRVLKP